MLADEDHVVLGAIAPLLLLEEGGALNRQRRGIADFNIGDSSPVAVVDVAGGNGAIAIFDHLAAHDIAACTIPFTGGSSGQLSDSGLGKHDRQGFDIGKLEGIHQLRHKICRAIHSLSSPRPRLTNPAQKV